MKKRYIKPEIKIEEVVISMQLLAGSPTIDIKDPDDDVDNFDQLL